MAKLAAGFTYTDQELLDLCREAYAKIMKNGQSFTIAGQQFNRANLASLRSEIDALETKVDGASSGVVFNKVNLRRAT